LKKNLLHDDNDTSSFSCKNNGINFNCQTCNLKAVAKQLASRPLELAAKAETAKTEPQNVGAELSSICLSRCPMLNL